MTTPDDCRGCDTMASIQAIVERLRDLAEAAEYRAEDLATADGLLDSADLLPFANLIESLHLRLQKGGERMDGLIVSRVRKSRRMPSPLGSSAVGRAWRHKSNGEK